MNKNEKLEDSAKPDTQKEVPSATPEQASQDPSKQAGDEKPKRKSSKFLKKALRWTVGVLIVFAVGVAATWVSRVQPKAEEIRNLDMKLSTAQSEIENLTSEVENLRPLLAENSKLEDDLKSAELHIDILDVIVKLTSAQFGIAEDDPFVINTALNGMDNSLEDLKKRFIGNNAQAITEMRDRLQLVVDELEDDDFAAKRDLEILLNDIVSFEIMLFGK